jgi:hypothetical protein
MLAALPVRSSSPARRGVASAVVDVEARLASSEPVRLAAVLDRLLFVLHADHGVIELS